MKAGNGYDLTMKDACDVQSKHLTCTLLFDT